MSTMALAWGKCPRFVKSPLTGFTIPESYGRQIGQDGFRSLALEGRICSEGRNKVQY